MKPFIKYVNYTHCMPTRYSIPSDMEPKALLSEVQMESADGRIEARRALAGTFKERFLAPVNSPSSDKSGSGKSAINFLKTKLRF